MQPVHWFTILAEQSREIDISQSDAVSLDVMLNAGTAHVVAVHLSSSPDSDMVTARKTLMVVRFIRRTIRRSYNGAASEGAAMANCE